MRNLARILIQHCHVCVCVCEYVCVCMKAEGLGSLAFLMKFAFYEGENLGIAILTSLPSKLSLKKDLSGKRQSC